MLDKDARNCVCFIPTETCTQGMSMFGFAFCVNNEGKAKTVAFAGYFTRFSVTRTLRRLIVEQGCTDFPEVEKQSQNSRRQKGEVKNASS